MNNLELIESLQYHSYKLCEENSKKKKELKNAGKTIGAGAIVGGVSGGSVGHKVGKEYATELGLEHQANKINHKSIWVRLNAEERARKGGINNPKEIDSLKHAANDKFFKRAYNQTYDQAGKAFGKKYGKLELLKGIKKGAAVGAGLGAAAYLGKKAYDHFKK